MCVFLLPVLKRSTRALNLGWNIRVDWQTIIFISVFIALLVMIEIIVLCQGVCVPTTSEKSAPLHRISSVKVTNIKTLSKRFHHTYRKPFLATMILFITSASALIIAGNAVIVRYNAALNGQCVATYTWSTLSVRNGMRSSQIENIKEICGVTNVCYAHQKNNAVSLRAETSDNDAYLKALAKASFHETTNDGRSVLVNLIGVPDNEYFEQYLFQMYGSVAGISEDFSEEFRSGNAALAYLPQIYENGDACHTVNESLLTTIESDENVKKTTLSTGSSITLSGDRFSAQVSLGVFSSFPGKKVSWQDEYTFPGTVFVSDSLFDKLVPASGRNYNIVWATEILSSDNVVAQQLEALRREDRVNFDSRHSINYENYLKFRNLLLICITAALFVSGIILFLLHSLAQRYKKIFTEEKRICDLLGMKKSLQRSLFERPGGILLLLSSAGIFIVDCIAVILDSSLFSYFHRQGFSLFTSAGMAAKSIIAVRYMWGILLAVVFIYTMAVWITWRNSTAS